MFVASEVGATPSMPSTRMLRFSRLSRRWEIAGLEMSTAERSSTTGLPTKKPGERARVWSISESQSTIGTLGANTKAT